MGMVQRCVRRAWEDTWPFFGSPKSLLVGGPLAFVAGTLVHVFKNGSTAAMDEVSIWLSYGLAGLLAAAAAVFLYNLVLAPYRIQRDRAEAAEAKLSHAARPPYDIKQPAETLPLYVLLQGKFDPDVGYLSPHDRVQHGIAQFKELYLRALQGDTEAYVVANAMGGWLSKSARFYYGSTGRFHEIQSFIDACLAELYEFSRGLKSDRQFGGVQLPEAARQAARHEWAIGKSRFQIWEAACFVTDTPLTAYPKSDKARGLASEILYFAREGYIDLAGEDQHIRNRRIMTGKPLIEFSEETYLGRETVEKIKADGGLSSWLPIVESVNKQRGF